jgi:predicted DNA-binding transcriptional regulator YafY
MFVESYQTLKRQWTMLRALPRWPLTVGVNAIVEQLRDAGYTTSRRTIERDLQELSRHLPLHVDDSRRPFRWSWAKEANFEFMPRLTASQSIALKLVQKHASPMMPQAMLDDLAPLFDAAGRELEHSGWKDWPERIAMLPPMLVLLPPRLAARVLADVHTALARRRILVAHYRSKRASAAEIMRVHALGLILRGPVQYLVCTIEGRERIRTLVLHRLSATSIAPTPSEEPRGFCFADYVATLAIAPKGRIRLRVRFHEFAGEHVRETPLSKDQKCTVVGEGVVEISATVQHDDQLEWWLLGYGGKVEVLKPVALRRAIADEHARAAKRYTG